MRCLGLPDWGYCRVCKGRFKSKEGQEMKPTIPDYMPCSYLSGGMGDQIPPSLLFFRKQKKPVKKQPDFLTNSFT